MQKKNDLHPFFNTATVGFDRIAEMIDRGLNGETSNQAFPPYNVEKLNDTSYRVVLAVAGFSIEDLEIETHEGMLEVRGNTKDADDKVTYLHRGIAARSFSRKFYLDEKVRVTSANLDNGLLSIELLRELPEKEKPVRIEINVSK
jgi:molecular chaperone IbpA